MNFKTRPGSEKIHRFRSKVLSICMYKDRLIALTERGIYRMDKLGKRFRKVKPKP